MDTGAHSWAYSHSGTLAIRGTLMGPLTHKHSWAHSHSGTHLVKLRSTKTLRSTLTLRGTHKGTRTLKVTEVSSYERAVLCITKHIFAG